MPCEYFLLIRRQRRPCLLAIDDGLSLASQHAGRGVTETLELDAVLVPYPDDGNDVTDHRRLSTRSIRLDDDVVVVSAINKHNTPRFTRHVTPPPSAISADICGTVM